MIKLIILKLFCLAYLFGQTQIQNYKIDIEYEKWENIIPIVNEGNYYYFEPLAKLNSSNVDFILGSMFCQGIIINEAWFQSHGASCGLAEIMVLPTLIIRVGDEIDVGVLNDNGFFKTGGVGVECHHNSIVHYSFKLEK